MTDKEKLTVETLRKRGLDNGTTLGWHAGICDEAADLIECLARERDAAVRDMRELCANTCLMCRKYGTCEMDVYDDCDENNRKHWEWRGVCAENTGGVTQDARKG